MPGGRVPSSGPPFAAGTVAFGSVVTQLRAETRAGAPERSAGEAVPVRETRCTFRALTLIFLFLTAGSKASQLAVTWPLSIQQQKPELKHRGRAVGLSPDTEPRSSPPEQSEYFNCSSSIAGPLQGVSDLGAQNFLPMASFLLSKSERFHLFHFLFPNSLARSGF